MLQPFHVAFPISDLAKAHQFYVQQLACPILAEDKEFLAVDFLGHYLAFREQKSNILQSDLAPLQFEHYSFQVPTLHIGIVIDKNTWLQFSTLFKNIGIEFIVPPLILYEGKQEEFGFMMIYDLCQIPFEFKYEMAANHKTVKPYVHNQAHSKHDLETPIA